MELVKPVNVRGEGHSIVFESSIATWTKGLVPRVIVKQQWEYMYRPVWNLGRSTPTVRNELRALSAFQRLGISVPSVVSYLEDGARAELVTVKIPQAVSMTVAMHDCPELAERIAISVALQLRRMHEHAWVHGALYPEHILVNQLRCGTAPQVFLIDLEKAKRSNKTKPDMERFWRYARFPNAEIAYCFEQAYSSPLSLSVDT